MSRTLLIVPLMLAMGVVLAEDAPEAEPAPTATEAPAQKEEAKTEDAKTEGAKTEDAKTEQAKKEQEAKSLSGMSILGNQEAPKSLVIVPWKSSELGNSLGIAPMLDDSRKPIDKDVFMRALSYYEIRSGRK
jgi:hypothetical protein